MIKQTRPFYIYGSVLILLFVTNLNITNDIIAQSQTLSETDFYEIRHVQIPDSIVLEVGGMTFNGRGDLAISTRRGEVWLLKNPDSDQPDFHNFGRGLHEPIGLDYDDGAYYVAQRGELTKLKDQSGNGQADVYQTIYRWPLSGNYHEYSYGPKFLPSGEMIVTLNLSWIGHGASLVKWRGWMLKITKDGKVTPIATGMRSPLGFGFNVEGEIFYTENQGDWIGSGWITHVEKGDFTGHPAGLEWSHLPESPLDLQFVDIDDSEGLTLHEQSKNIPELKNPSIWLPHTIMGISTSDLLLIENDNQIGPFKGQFLVGDQGHSKIMRVAMEKIKGEYQGAVFDFREGFSSGITRMVWGPDHQLYVGLTNRGWSSLGDRAFGIDRVQWNREIPFVMHSIQAESNGFTIEFTKPIDEQSAINLDNYQITDFTYNYDRLYGSPVVNRQLKQVKRIELSQDRRSVRLYIDGLREGYINEIRAEGVISSDGISLLHSVGYYTLNNLPEGDRSVEAIGNRVNTPGDPEAEASMKKITDMPQDWEDGPDMRIELATEPGLRYDLDEITVEAGSRVALTFTNDDDMVHNVVIVEPGSADEVGVAAMNLGLDADALEFVPIMDEILYHTSILQPGQIETIYFTVPEIPGKYQFVCTFPGHHISMRGILQVVDP